MQLPEDLELFVFADPLLLGSVGELSLQSPTVYRPLSPPESWARPSPSTLAFLH
jgi:hypothetical protein